MRVNVAEWLADNKRVYSGNATTVRDYRSQLRGNRPLYIWGLYLFILVGIVGLAYDSIVPTSGPTSVASAQNDLANFYQTVIALLATGISLMAPALTAVTIVSERQNKLIDLVFSSPVTLKYYLVGKILSGMRYTWMLLALALPIASVCVVMGGATWGDVLGAYLLLASSGLIFTAFGLMMSALSKNTASAVAGTYSLVVIYSIFSAVPGGLGLALRPLTGGAATNEQSWLVAINPFMAGIGAPTFTTLLGVEIPNWVFVALFALLLTKFVILGTAAAMSHYGSPESISFRLHGVVYSFLFAWLLSGIGAGLATMGGMASGGGPSVMGVSSALAMSGGMLTIFFTLFVPTLSVFSLKAGLRNRPDGLMNWRRTLMGTPGSALPYSLLLVTAVFAGVVVGALMAGPANLDGYLLMGFLWSVSLMVFWWGLARLFSLTDSLTGAKALTVAATIGLYMLPPIAAGMMVTAELPPDQISLFWKFYILYPIGTGEHLMGSWPHIVLMLVVGIGLGLFAERNVRARAARLGDIYGTSAR